MKWKIMSATFVLVLILVITILFQVKIPMCYNTFEEQPKEAFILYDTKIIDVINQQIEESSFYYINILGNSMFPSIKGGDTCVCIPQNDYNEGDVISFFVPTGDKVELIAHRIATENNNQFTTKGDNNNIKDSWIITEDQIFCKIPEKNLFNKFRFAVVESGGKFSIFSIVG